MLSDGERASPPPRRRGHRGFEENLNVPLGPGGLAASTAASSSRRQRHQDLQPQGKTPRRLHGGEFIEALATCPDLRAPQRPRRLHGGEFIEAGPERVGAAHRRCLAASTAASSSRLILLSVIAILIAPRRLHGGEFIEAADR